MFPDYRPCAWEVPQVPSAAVSPASLPKSITETTDAAKLTQRNVRGLTDALPISHGLPANDTLYSGDGASAAAGALCPLLCLA